MKIQVIPKRIKYLADCPASWWGQVASLDLMISSVPEDDLPRFERLPPPLKLKTFSCSTGDRRGLLDSVLGWLNSAELVSLNLRSDLLDTSHVQQIYEGLCLESLESLCLGSSPMTSEILVSLTRGHWTSLKTLILEEASFEPWALEAFGEAVTFKSLEKIDIRSYEGGWQHHFRVVDVLSASTGLPEEAIAPFAEEAKLLRAEGVL